MRHGPTIEQRRLSRKAEYRQPSSELALSLLSGGEQALTALALSAICLR
jgi:hypothetical protein